MQYYTTAARWRAYTTVIVVNSKEFWIFHRTNGRIIVYDKKWSYYNDSVREYSSFRMWWWFFDNWHGTSERERYQTYIYFILIFIHELSSNVMPTYGILLFAYFIVSYVYIWTNGGIWSKTTQLFRLNYCINMTSPSLCQILFYDFIT